MPAVTPKLTFSVGEKVVICGEETSFSGNDSWPDKNNFCFTTIKEVRPDGKVVVEGGYVYRQSYKTFYGEVELHDYFRIVKTPKNGYTHFESPQYMLKYNKVDENSTFVGTTFLLKYSPAFDEKVQKAESAYDERLEKEIKAQQVKNKKQPFLDAYHKTIQPFEDALRREEIKAWKENICKNCKNNKNGYCIIWDKTLATYDVSGCSGFDVEVED